MPLVNFHTPPLPPPRTHKNPKDFLCFQGVQKENSGMKWADAKLEMTLLSPFHGGLLSNTVSVFIILRLPFKLQALGILDMDQT